MKNIANIKTKICVFWRPILVVTMILVALRPTPTYAYKVFPTISEADAIFDKANYPFIAEHADGIRVQFKGLSTFSNQQVQLLLNQYKNKKVIMHGVYSGKEVTQISGTNKLPSTSNVEAMFLYTEAPAMSTAEWRDVINQNPPFPVITHCRSFTNGSSHTELREQILLSSGVVMEMRVDDVAKYKDAVDMIKFCVDNNRIASFLTTFQLSREYFLSAYKDFYYYIKENLPARYLASDQVIFMPNTYSDAEVFPDTPGAGGTFGVGRWLIEQKANVNDGYLQPKVTISSPKTKDFFPNGHNLSVTVNAETAVTSVQLFLDNKLIGTDNSRPFTFSGGLISNLQTGLHDIKAVGRRANGDLGTSVIQIKILEGAVAVPGVVLPGQGSDFSNGLVPLPDGNIAFVRRNDWFDLKVDVTKDGLYDVDVDIKIKRPKYFGGTVILSQGNKELGRVSSVINDPALPALPGFSETPTMVIRNVALKKGEQTIRVSFTLSSTTVNRPLFFVGALRFDIQGGPVIKVLSPAKDEAGEFQDVDAPGNIVVRSSITSPRSSGQIRTAQLFVNDELVSTLRGAGPYNWNTNQEIGGLSNLESGTYRIKIVATDESGFSNFNQFNVRVINRRPFSPNLKIPGTIEAYHFDLGGEGVGYLDFNEGIERGLSGAANPRFDRAGNEDVELESVGRDYAVSAIRDKEWLSYTLQSVEAGTYTIKALAATNAGKTSDIEVWLNYEKIGAVRITETGSSFNDYKEFTVSNIVIPENRRQSNLRLVFKEVNASSFLFFLRQVQFIKTQQVVNRPPVVAITAPGNNATFEVGQEITFTANASDPDGNLDKVNFKVNDEFYRTVATRPFQTTFVPTAAGTYKIAALAIDKENARTEVFVTITVLPKNLAPLASFTTPAGSTLEEGYPELVVTVEASDPNGDAFSILLKINGREVRSESVAPYEWGHAGSPDPLETVGLPVGEHVLEAVVTDAKGLSTTISRTLTVTEPVISSTNSALDGQQFSVFPNPSESGVFHLSAPSVWQVYNLRGTTIQSGTGDAIDLSSEPKGMYILKANGAVMQLMHH